MAAAQVRAAARLHRRRQAVHVRALCGDQRLRASEHIPHEGCRHYALHRQLHCPVASDLRFDEIQRPHPKLRTGDLADVHADVDDPCRLDDPLVLAAAA